MTETYTRLLLTLSSEMTDPNPIDKQEGVNCHSQQRLVSAQEPIFLSLGAGVQSSCMALMAAHGEIPMPHCAIFADTQAEPSEVYKWLDWLEAQLPYPVHRVTAGNIELDIINACKGKERMETHQPPFYIKGPDGNGQSMKRWCTREYKLRPIRREQNRLCSQLAAKRCKCWVGISLDESHRMKDSGVAYVVNEFPLIDARMTRHDCKLWLDRHGYPVPPKSACRWCPYKDRNSWRVMKATQPEDFAASVALDSAIRTGLLKTQQVFVHPSCQPLDAVDFSTDEDNGQLTMFGNECEGLCGV